MNLLKKINLAILSSIPVFGVLSICVQGAYAQQPIEVRWLPESVFTPSGFDDNDNVQIVIDGNLPNTCYRAGPTDISIDAQNKVIRIVDKAYLYQGGYCLMTLVPYTKTLSLGVLAAGKYRIEFEDTDGEVFRRGLIRIAASKDPGPDSELYAPIAEAFLESPSDRKKRVLIMRGYFSNTCLEMGEVKAIRNEPDVIEVMPLMKEVSGPDCKAKQVPFEYRFPIRANLLPKKAGKYLIHIRSLNGQSINLVVY
jgi:hypothetical protein